MRSFKSEKLILGISLALLLGACGKTADNAATTSPLTLINAADAKACAHPEVLKVLQGLIGTPKGNEETVLPVNAAQVSAMTLPPVVIDRISLASVDASVKRLTCTAMSTISADIRGAPQKFEREIIYSVSPSASNEREFIVSTDASVATDRINIAIAKAIALGVQKNEQDNATAARLQAALAEANSGGSAPAASPAASAGDDAIERQYTPAYGQCMNTGEAAEGVTVAMVDCTNAELKVQDGRLNRAYGAAMGQRDAAQKETLRAAQRAWIKQRDTKCQEGLEGGTMDLINESGCHLSMTTARATELEQMVKAL